MRPPRDVSRAAAMAAIAVVAVATSQPNTVFAASSALPSSAPPRSPRSTFRPVGFPRSMRPTGSSPAVVGSLPPLPVESEIKSILPAHMIPSKISIMEAPQGPTTDPFQRVPCHQVLKKAKANPRMAQSLGVTGFEVLVKLLAEDDYPPDVGDDAEKLVMHALKSIEMAVKTQDALDWSRLISFTNCAIDEDGRTILMKMVRHGLHQAINFSGANRFAGGRMAHLLDKKNNNLLHLAASSDHTATVMHIANALGPEALEALEQRNADGDTPRSIALKHRRVDVYDALQRIHMVRVAERNAKESLAKMTASTSNFLTPQRPKSSSRHQSATPYSSPPSSRRRPPSSEHGSVAHVSTPPSHVAASKHISESASKPAPYGSVVAQPASVPDKPVPLAAHAASPDSAYSVEPSVEKSPAPAIGDSMPQMPHVTPMMAIPAGQLHQPPSPRTSPSETPNEQAIESAGDETAKSEEPVTADDEVAKSADDEVVKSADGETAKSEEPVTADDEVVKSADGETAKSEEPVTADDEVVKSADDQVVKSADGETAKSEEPVTADDEVVKSADDEVAKSADDEVVKSEEPVTADDEVVKSADDEVVKSADDEAAKSEEPVTADDEVAKSADGETAKSEEPVTADDEVVESADDEAAKSADGETAKSEEPVTADDEVVKSADDEVAKSADDEVAKSADGETAKSEEPVTADDEVVKSADDEVVKSEEPVTADDEVAKSADDEVAKSADDEVAKSADGETAKSEEPVTADDEVAKSADDEVVKSADGETAKSEEPVTADEGALYSEKPVTADTADEPSVGGLATLAAEAKANLRGAAERTLEKVNAEGKSKLQEIKKHLGDSNTDHGQISQTTAAVVNEKPPAKAMDKNDETVEVKKEGKSSAEQPAKKKESSGGFWGGLASWFK